MSPDPKFTSEIDVNKYAELTLLGSISRSHSTHRHERLSAYLDFQTLIESIPFALAPRMFSASSTSPIKRGRGRPRKHPLPLTSIPAKYEVVPPRGVPRLASYRARESPGRVTPHSQNPTFTPPVTKRGPGRPPQAAQPATDDANELRGTMQYTHLKGPQLRAELKRRNLATTGGYDAMIERLLEDNAERGSEATTLSTTLVKYVPRPLNLVTAGYGLPEDPAVLVGSDIIHYALNPFGLPTLTLYLTSGHSATISGAALRNALIGIDPQLLSTLRRLTGSDGPDNEIFPGSHPHHPLRILGASYAERISTAAKELVHGETEQWQTQRKASLRGLGLAPKEVGTEKKPVWEERHVVLGLRLRGMLGYGYVFAYDASGEDEAGEEGAVDQEGGCWGDVELHAAKKEVWEPLRVVEGAVVRGVAHDVSYVEEEMDTEMADLQWHGADTELSELSDVDEEVLRGGTVDVEAGVVESVRKRARYDSGVEALPDAEEDSPCPRNGIRLDAADRIDDAVRPWEKLDAAPPAKRRLRGFGFRKTWMGGL
ncbi:uncharacterized protein BDZ99DRAFT_528093 [Mytilinidion resinicola]|uniref:SAP domain-containing protein n=1 Tax=Mytilinidion resinicola TaxID=574789 RepID=A0A6A6XZ92_9PEZI|nr:uncharacterized protein BDZ99DRAFT_528093 [Mytilinidion resinicola]KAF2801881.1 hypothetical protein BDZ99DRAFT_528093 [Mytilinidion resinicola]